MAHIGVRAGADHLVPALLLHLHHRRCVAVFLQHLPGEPDAKAEKDRAENLKRSRHARPSEAPVERHQHVPAEPDGYEGAHEKLVGARLLALERRPQALGKELWVVTAEPGQPPHACHRHDAEEHPGTGPAHRAGRHEQEKREEAEPDKAPEPRQGLSRGSIATSNHHDSL
jgi:hypothetical protein